MNVPVWQPRHPENSRMHQFMRYVEKRYSHKLNDYSQLYHWSIEQPVQFWQSIANFFVIEWDVPPEEILNQHQHMLEARWFEGAKFNFAGQLLKRNDDYPAIVSLDESGKRQVLTYRQLRQQVAECAQGLKNAGVRTGDRVAAIMPNVASTIIAMLAASSLGAIWSSCSPDFGAQAAIDRLGQVEPKVLFACNGHQYIGKTHLAQEKIAEIKAAIPSIEKVVICPVIDGDFHIKAIEQGIWWKDFLKPADDCQFTSLPFAHPLYILFSSGTTGKPKCIMHGAGGTLLQHLKELGLHTNISEQDNLCFYTTCGWMMWNWMVSVLALGATLTLYEGAPNFPDSYRLFQLIDEEKVSVFGTSAKFLSAVEKAGAIPCEHYSMSALKTILSTGSPLLPKNYDFVYEKIKSDVQLSSISGGTDIVSCFALGNPALPVYRGELQCRGLGMAVSIFNEEGQPIQEECGELVCTQAFPSMPVGFWNDPDRKAYKRAYFERFEQVWAHGDYAELTPHDGLIIYGRSDAVLNPGGVRIGTAEIYRQVEKIEEVLESIVIAQKWDDDVRVVLFVKLRNGLKLSEELQQKIKDIIRKNASPRHVPAKILQVSDIPRTMSGKIVEVAVRQVVHGETVSNLSSLANPEALEYYKDREELKV
ncbi:acetoacetyl CoA synthetase [Legionella birminghamensis]|uniref:Acetoacetyl CoA synthetase n=1 Tax=Legionella birminghamensis TaxID=28083 RepID=A0A378IBH6_9GAMM|nr:acetoacetate--CoA ligase [Legionella birminghamensis]KTC73040.1 acetoacetyl CoA synthetase [Legionella birminghamensis]STX32383.1 acetoacetyl CoA synthetase [Legionella birminghamensis]